MEEESFTQSLSDTPDDLAADGTLTVMRTEDFGAWYRRVRDAHEREVDALRGDTYLDAVSDSVLAKHGLVRMPVDADGVTIRVGDTLDGYGKTIEVVELRYGRSGWVLISRDGNGYADCAAFTHHHAPTVEGVLREFTRDWCNAACAGDMTNAERDAARVKVIAEYAARLRLAGEE